MVMMMTMRVTLSMVHRTRLLVAAHQAVDSDLWVLCQLQLRPAQSSSAQVCYSKSTGQFTKTIVSYTSVLGV